MFKKTFLFITTILAATSASTGYGTADTLKGAVNVETFLDWFNNTEKYVHVKGLIVFDLIPILFLIIQTVLFFKERKKAKGILTALALLANLIGVCIVIQYAHPIASQMLNWTPENLPPDWVQVKDEWFKYIGLNGLMSMGGWLCFVITYFLSTGKKTEGSRLHPILNFFKNALLFFLTFLLGMGAAGLYEYFFLPHQIEISGATFIEMHRPVDLIMRKVGPVMFVFIVSLKVLLAALLFIERSKYKGWLIIGALIFLLCDTFIALQFNRPINDLFLTWTPATIPSNWTIIREEWLCYHFYRNIFKILGIAAILLVYFVPKKDNEMQVL